MYNQWETYTVMYITLYSNTLCVYEQQGETLGYMGIVHMRVWAVNQKLDLSLLLITQCNCQWCLKTCYGMCAFTDWWMSVVIPTTEWVQ